MRETINRMWVAARDWFSKLSMGSRIRLGVLALGVIVLAIVVVSLLTRTVWVPIADIDDITKLNEIERVLYLERIPTQREGFIIEVPENRLLDAQAVLSENGLVGTQIFTDDILASASSFGVSAEHAKKVYDAQTAERLTIQLRAVPRIRNAFVIVNSGESSPFRIQTNTRKPTAQVQVQLADDGTLSASEAMTIADMVKAAVPGLEYEDISISDTTLRSYNTDPNAEEEQEEMTIEQRYAFQSMMAEQRKEMLESLFNPVFGPDNVKISAYVTLNFDKVTEDIRELSPPVPGEDQGMWVSTEEIREIARGMPYAAGIPGTDTNALGSGETPEYPWGEFDENTQYWREIIRHNYDMNETFRQITHAQGEIEEIGVTVLINSEYMGEGIEPPDYREQIRNTVASATGASRGNIAVEYVAFDYVNTWYEEVRLAQAEREARERTEWIIEQVLQYGTILALAIMVILLVRSVVKALRPEPEPELVLAAEGPMVGMDIDFMVSEEVIDTEQEQKEIIEEIDLNVKSAGLEQIERFIEKDPETVAQLLRNWLSDE